MPEKSFKLALVAVAALVLVACGEKAGQKGAAGSAKGSTVLAVVNGKKITAEDMKTEAANLSPYAVQALSDKKTREKFLDNLVSKELIVQEAEKKGLDKDPEVVKKLDEVRRNLLAGMFVKNEIFDKAAVTDQTVKDYFEKNRQDLGSVRLSHILVRSEPEAETVLAKAKAGESFQKLAKQFSLDSKTRNSGGDLGYVQWAQFGSPSLKEAAFKLKPGETSSIVQSQFGYHIMKVTDKKPASDADFTKMKDELKQVVAEKTKEDLFNSTVKGLKDKAKVTTNAEALDSLDLAGAGETSLGPTPKPGEAEKAK